MVSEFDKLRGLLNRFRQRRNPHREDTTVGQWLEDIEHAGRELVDPVAGIDALDAIHSKGTRPTVGWMQRNTRAV